MTEEDGEASLMGVPRLKILSADDSRAYSAARELISQIVGVLSARAALAVGDAAVELRESQLRYSRELQRLGMPDGVSVQRVLADYPAVLVRLRGGQ